MIAYLRPSPKLVLGQKRVTLESLLMAQIGYSLSDLIQLYKLNLSDQVKTISN